MAQVTDVQPSLFHLGSQGLLRLLMPDGDREFVWEVPGQFRRYANGTVRLITQTGVRQAVDLSVAVDRAGLLLLRSWAGTVVLYRDGLGERTFCSYLEVNAEPSNSGRLYVVQLALQQLTYVETV
jgi:hypothetical protein